MRSSPKPLRWVGLLIVALAGPSRAEPPAPSGDISDLNLARPEDKVDAPSIPPPSGAAVLFEGTRESLDQWTKIDGKSPASWELVGGGARQLKGGNIITRQKFNGRFKLHVDFRISRRPGARGQGRGHSGVYLQGRYEVQILDSHGRKSQDNDCGGISSVATPRVNACKAPTVWQSFDIDFRAPRFQAGEEVAPARISVVHNGETIHEDVKIPVENTTAGLGGDPSTPGPIMLQDHGNPVQFRNIGLLPQVA
jgi:hypothetical protein